MSDMVYKICALGRSTICLGRQLDNKARRILFDVTEWMERWPGATVAGFAVPPIGEGYPIALEVHDGTAVWTVLDSDTATSGRGMVQIVLLGKDGEKLHSANAMTLIEPSAAASAGETPPNAAKPWFEQLMREIDKIKESGVSDEQIAEAIEDYLDKHPIEGGAGIDDTTPSAKTTYSSQKIETELNKQKKAKADKLIGIEHAGKLLYVGADGMITPLTLGAGLAIVGGVLTITSASVTAAICGQAVCGETICGG